MNDEALTFTDEQILDAAKNAPPEIQNALAITAMQRELVMRRAEDRTRPLPGEPQTPEEEEAALNPTVNERREQPQEEKDKGKIAAAQGAYEVDLSQPVTKDITGKG